MKQGEEERHEEIVNCYWAPSWRLAALMTAPLAMAADKIVIGHSQPNLGWPYIAAVTNALEAAAKGMEGVEVVTLSGDGDIAKQSSDIGSLVDRKVNVLLVTSLDGNAVIPALKKAHDAGIPDPRGFQRTGRTWPGAARRLLRSG